MSLGDLTKQLAKEVVGAQVEEVLGGAKPAEGAKSEPGADSAAGLIMAEVQKMQAALKDDKELLVQCVAAGETLRVVEMFAPSGRVLVLTGLDVERMVTRVVAGADTVQLVCKPVTVKEGAKATRIRFVSAKG
ncbi:MAG TPA: hypothetical protein VFB63_11755 [Bryobacteraceae bacterium]|nr:hypothetical protein [Bryobacteraceae bacterium]